MSAPAERAPAVVAEPPHRVGDAARRRRDRAALARRDDLARVEDEAAEHAERAARPTAAPRAPSAPAASSTSGRSGSSSTSARPAEQVHRQDGLRPRRRRPRRAPGRGSSSPGRRRRAPARRPASATTFAVAGNVYAGTSTSSPGCSSSASTARCSAAVPDETATACSTLARARELLLELGHLRAHRQLAASRAPRATAASLLGADVGPGETDRGLLLPVPSDRPREAVVELDLRLAAEQLARLLDVGDAQLDVGVVERHEDDLAGRRRRAA